MPRGSPSRVSQISVTAAALCVSYKPKPGTSRAGSFDEQLDRVRSDAAVERQRRDRQQRLAGDPQVLARGGQHLGVAGPTEDPCDRRAGGVEHVLAVVDHEQQPSAGDRLGDGVDQLGVTLRSDAQSRRNGGRHRRRVADRSELDEPHTIGKLVGHLGADLESESRLADSTHATQRVTSRLDRTRSATSESN